MVRISSWGYEEFLIINKRRKERISMEMKEVKCGNCGKDIYVLENGIRKKMFCTLGCMNTYSGPSNKIPSNS